MKALKRAAAGSLAWIALSLCAANALAQGPAAKSPEVHADGTVTFHLKASGAAAVVLKGDWPGGYQSTSAPMTKDAQGLWSVTVGPIKPDVWFYTFDVDGVSTPDAANPHNEHDGAIQSQLFIPGPESADYEAHDVPHGTVSAVWYASPSLGIKERRALVYTPPGYDAGRQKYPVLYLLYGDETQWNALGRASIIMDNLIAAGKAKPMIVVMPSSSPGHAASEQYVDQPLAGGGGDTGGFNTPAMLPVGRSFATELVPFIDGRYRTLADRDHRAIAGLSSPGALGFYAAMNNLNLFAWVGTFSGGYSTLPGVATTTALAPHPEQYIGPPLTRQTDPQKLMALVPALNAKANLRLLYLSVGMNDTLFMTSHPVMKKLLEEKGVKYTAVEVPGYHHEWRFWRWSLKDFAPRLFQDGGVK